MKIEKRLSGLLPLKSKLTCIHSIWSGLRFVALFAFEVYVNMHPLNMECGGIGGIIIPASSYIDIEFEFTL